MPPQSTSRGHSVQETGKEVALSRQTNSFTAPSMPKFPTVTDTVSGKEATSIEVSPSSSYNPGESDDSSHESISQADFPITKGETDALANKNRAAVDLIRAQMQQNPELARNILQSLKTQQDGFCQLSILKPSKKGGYVQLSSQGANKFAVLQEVLLWAKGEKAVYGDHVSHLCDKPKCMLPEHMYLESPVVNNSRKNCGKIIKCADCPKHYQACDHSPRCITFVERYASWEEFLAEGLHD